MSKIRLHGSSSGYTEIAPVAASGNNTLTLPNDGTIISKDSNGAVGVTSITVGTGVTIGDGRVTCSTLHGSAANCTQIPAANIVGVCTAGFERTGGFGGITMADQWRVNSGFGSVVTAYGVRAWADIYWNSGTPTARANGNVSSISDDGTGDMTISFSTAMPDTNYSCLVSGDDYGNSSYPGFNVGSTSRGKTTGGVTFNATQKDGTARDIAAVNFAVIR